MGKVIVTRGKLTAPRRIDLEEPIDDVKGDVEVTVRTLDATASPAQDVFQFIDSLVPAARTRAEIDEQLADERSSWPDR